MKWLYCLLVCIFLGSAVSQNVVNLSELRASWTDPLSSEFRQTLVESPLLSNLTSNSRVQRDACPCTNIFQENTYSGGTMPQELIEALSYAQCHWSCILDLPANSVQLQVVRTQGAPGVLASAGPNMSNQGNKVVPCPLAGCSGMDIQMNVDPDSIDYYYGTDGRPGPNQYDFVTIALHELGHGFGMIGYITPSGTGYRAPGPSLCDFDARIRTGSNTFPWAQNPPASSSSAISAVTSGNLYFEGNTHKDIKLYAPASYNQGSSVYHLDESSYPAGDANSLMTPMLGNGEAIHSVGRYLCDVLKTIGYSIPSWEACESSTPSGSGGGGSAPAPAPPSGPTPTRTPSPPSQPEPSGTPEGECDCQWLSPTIKICFC